jgi:putative copper export protein
VNWLQFTVQWLHVLLGILWFGYALSMYFLVSPALMRLPEPQLRDVNVQLGRTGARVFPFVAIAVLVLGFVRGTFLGPIRSIEDAFGTAYGITWLVAIVLTLGLVFTGARYIGPGWEKLHAEPDLPAAIERLRAITRIDLVLFFGVFTCMILMRFGL